MRVTTLWLGSFMTSPIWRAAMLATESTPTLLMAVRIGYQRSSMAPEAASAPPFMSQPRMLARLTPLWVSSVEAAIMAGTDTHWKAAYTNTPRQTPSRPFWEVTSAMAGMDA